MKTRFSALVLVLAASLFPTALSAGKDGSDRLTVMSYNIRFAGAEDGTNSWIYRYYLTPMMIQDQKPDVIGLQEAVSSQVLYLSEYAKPYKYVGAGRDDGRKKGEYTAIFYNPKTVKLSKWGMFWLSDTPEKPGLGWDAACPRTATWAIMKDKRNGKSFMVVNTHLDHVGKQAQAEGAALILRRIEELNSKGLPVVLMGDFNLSQDDPVLGAVDRKMENTRKTALKSDGNVTYNAWGKLQFQSRIDHIYQKGFRRCQEFKVLTKKYDNRAFISDHFPVMAELVF